MKLWEIALIVVAVNALVAAALLGLRRRAPRGSFYKETQLAAGALSVSGTIFAVLVGFVFLLSFQSYERARSSAQDEAVAAVGLFHIAAELPQPAGSDLQADVVCYGRAVVAVEWPAMAHQDSSPLVDRWLSTLSRRFATYEPRAVHEPAAAEDWLRETDSLQQGRYGRLAEAPGVVPGTIWVLLIAVGVGVVAFVLLFANPAELRLSQWMMITSVTTGVVASLLIVNFLDRPYGHHAGAIEPTAMQRAVMTMDRQSTASGRSVHACDPAGRPVGEASSRS